MKSNPLTFEEIPMNACFRHKKHPDHVYNILSKQPNWIQIDYGVLDYTNLQEDWEISYDFGKTFESCDKPSLT